MKNKDAIKWIKAIKEKYIHGGDESFDEYRKESLDMAIKALEAQGWIPVITKELSEEEIRFIEESDGFVDFDFGCDEWSSNMWKYESELPKDEQRILITTKEGWIDTDTFHREERNECWFEFYDNKDEVLAWMPLPEPYTKEETT